MAGKKVNGFIESLTNRVIPDALGNIFPDEKKNIQKFGEDLEKTKDIFGKARKDINDTFNELGNYKSLTKKLRDQARTGKFGLSDKDKDSISDRVMGLGGDLDSFDEDAFDNLDFGDDISDSPKGTTKTSKDGTSVTNIKKVFAPTINKSGGNNKNIVNASNQNTAVLSNQLGQMVAVQAQIGQAQIGLLTSLNHQIGSIGELLNTNTKAFYESSDEYYKLQAGNSEKHNAVIDMLGDKLRKEKEAEDRRMAAKMGMGGTDFNGLFDPSKAASSLEGVNSMIFGQLGGLRETLAKVSADPLGMLLSAGIGFGARKYGGNAINSIKNFTGSLGYRSQGMFERWSNNQFNGGGMDFVKGLIGDSLKTSRVKSDSVQLGKFSEDEAIPFDTNTRKSIVDTIPMYLAKILNALTKSEGFEVYNQKTGQFENSKKLAEDAKNQVQSLKDGQFMGGLGNEIFGLQFETNEEDFKTIREKLIQSAMSDTSYKTDIRRLKMGNTSAQKAYKNYLDNMSDEDYSSLVKTFQGHKYELGNAVRNFNEEFSSGGASQAAILEGIDRDLIKETRGEDIKKRKRKKRKKGGADDVDDFDLSDLIGDLSGKGGSNKLTDIFGRINQNIQGKVGADGKPLTGGLRDVFDMVKNGSIKKASDLRNLLGGNKGDNGDYASIFSLMKSKGVKSFDDISKILKLSNQGADTSDILSRLRTNAGDVGKDIKGRASNAMYKVLSMFGIKKESIDAVRNNITNSVKRLFGKGKGIIGPDGKKITPEELDKMSFRDLISSKFDQAIVSPIKGLFGKGKGIIDANGKTLSDGEIKSMSFKDLISNKLDHSLVRPLKGLFGKGKGLKDADGKTISDDVLKGMNFTSLIGMKIDQGMIKPMKRLFAKGRGLKDADGNVISADAMESMNIFGLFGTKLDQSIMVPMKNLLLGKHSINNGGEFDPSKTSIFTVVKTSIDEYVSKPIKRLMFGDGSENKSFLSNLGGITSPFFNKLFFGENSSKRGLADNFKDFGSRMWKATHERFIKPAQDAVKNLFGPVFSEFKDTLKGTAKDFFESLNINFSKGFKEGAKGFLTTVFGDETIKTLKLNLVDPINKAAKTISDSLSNVFKFLLRIPANLISGLTDRMKFSRMQKGKGNYSEEERSRLSALGESGKFFNFKNLGKGQQLDLTLEGIKNGLSTRLQNGKNSIKNRVSNLSDRVGGIRDDAMNSIRNHSGNLSERIKNSKVSTKLSNIDSENLKETIRNRMGLGGKPLSAKTAVSTPLNGVSLLSSIKKIQSDVKVHISPSVSSIKTITGNIFAFLKKNLTGTTDRLTTLIKLLRTGGKTTKGKDGSIIKGKKGIFGRLLGGFGFMGDIVGKIIEIPMRIITSFGMGLAKVVDAVKSIPAMLIRGALKITATIGKVAMNLIEGASKLIAPVINIGLTAFKKTVEVAGSAISMSVELAGKAVIGLGRVADKTVTVLGKTFVFAAKATTTLTKGIWTVAKTFGKVSLEAGKLAVKFAWATAKMAGRAVTGLARGVMGKRLSSDALINAKALIAASKLSPLHVYVTDGKIATYEHKTRRNTIFNKGEKKLRGLKLKNEKKNNSLLALLLPALAGLKGIMSKVMTTLGMKRAADMINGGGNGGIFGGGNDRRRRRPPGGGNGGGFLGKLKGGFGKFGGNLLKGGVKGFGWSMLGNLGADLLFDEGSTAHNVTSKASTYGGWGAMIGSVIPGLGTAVGGLIGAAIGGVMGLFPEIEGKIGEAWDWAKVKLGEFFGDTWKVMKIAATNIWGGIKKTIDFLTPIGKALWKGVKKVWDVYWGVSKVVWKGIKWIAGAISDTVGWISDKVSAIFDGVLAVGNLVGKTLVAMGDKVMDGVNWTKDKLVEGWETTKATATEYWNKTKAVGGWLSDKWDSIQGGVTGAFDWVSDKFTSAKNVMSTVASDSMFSVTGAVSSMFGFISDGISNIGKSVTKGFMNMTGNVGVGMKEMVTKGITGFRAMLGKLSIDVPFFGKLTLPGGITEEEADRQMKQIDADSKAGYQEVKRASAKLASPKDALKTWDPTGTNKVAQAMLGNLKKPTYNEDIDKSTQEALAKGKGVVDPNLVSGSDVKPIPLPNAPAPKVANPPSDFMPSMPSSNGVSDMGIAPPEAPFSGDLGQSVVSLLAPQPVSYSQIPNSDGSIDSTLNMLAAVGIATGVDPRLLMGIANAESGFKANAQNPGKGQTAGGLFQFIDSTWNGMLKAYGPKFGLPANTSKHDPRANSLMGALYIRQNLEGLKSTLNRPLVTTDAYMAHFLGLGGARNFFRQSPDAPASSFLTPDGLNANRTIAYNSNGQMRTTSGVYQVMANKLNKGSKYVDKVMSYASKFGKHGFPPSMPGAGGMPLLNGQSGDSFDPSSLQVGGADNVNGFGAAGSGVKLFNGVDAEELLNKMGGGDKLGTLLNKNYGLSDTSDVNIIGSGMAETANATLENNTSENTKANIQKQTENIVDYESGNKVDSANATGKAINEASKIEVKTDNSDVTAEQATTNDLLGKILSSLNEKTIFAGETSPSKSQSSNIVAVGSNPNSRDINSRGLQPSNASINLAKGGADI